MLIYTGGGYGGALPGIPARDLTAAEVKRYGGEEYLLSTGLYKPQHKTKMRLGGTENKAAEVKDVL